eukprot:2774782-Pleurochrysis_carterae.AAC.4
MTVASSKAPLDEAAAPSTAAAADAVSDPHYGPSQGSSAVAVQVEVMHTLNIPNKGARTLFDHAVVTKYVIRVALGVEGAAPRIEWQVLATSPRLP